MKKLIFTSTVILFVLTGCNNEDDLSSDVSSQEAQEVVDNTAASMSGDIVSLVESEGVEELIHLVELLDEYALVGGRVSQKSWTKERLKTISHYFVNGPAARTGTNEPQSFDDIKGLYTWNFELEDFDVEDSEFFIVRFPSEGSSTNNVEFKISTLEFVTVTDSWEDIVDEYEVPSKIEAYLKLDDAVLADLNYAVDWSSNGTPEKADVSLFLAPFKFVINFSDTFAKSTSLLTSISINDELIASVDVDVTYETDSKDDVIKVEGNVQYRGLKIDGNIDATKIGLDGDPNDFVELTLYADNAKIGDIIFELEEDDDGFQDYVPYVMYEDGTKESLEAILAPVFEEINSILSDVE